MKSPEEQAAIRAGRKRAAVMQILGNLHEELDIARGRLKRSKLARERGDKALGGNVEGLAAEIVRVEAAIAKHVEHHGLAA